MKMVVVTQVVVGVVAVRVVVSNLHVGTFVATRYTGHLSFRHHETLI